MSGKEEILETKYKRYKNKERNIDIGIGDIVDIRAIDHYTMEHGTDEAIHELSFKEEALKIRVIGEITKITEYYITILNICLGNIRSEDFEIRYSYMNVVKDTILICKILKKGDTK